MAESEKIADETSKDEDGAGDDAKSSEERHDEDENSSQRSEKDSDSSHTGLKRHKAELDEHSDASKRKKACEGEPGDAEAPKTEDGAPEAHAALVDLLNNTTEYDCPIARLAKMDPGDGFFSRPSREPPEHQDPPTTEDDPPEAQLALESSLGEREALLGELVRDASHPQRDCRLSVFRGAEWSVPVPAVAQLIVNRVSAPAHKIQDSDARRLVCLQLGTGRLLLNSPLLPAMSFRPLRARSIVFSAQTLGGGLLPHRLLFADEAGRDAFHRLHAEREKP